MTDKHSRREADKKAKDIAKAEKYLAKKDRTQARRGGGKHVKGGRTGGGDRER